jgi:glyoxylase I family protein
MPVDRRTVITGAAAPAALRTAAPTTSDAAEIQMNAPTERVLGIGGLFFRSRDPKKLTEWYQVHLGMTNHRGSRRRAPRHSVPSQ